MRSRLTPPPPRDPGVSVVSEVERLFWSGKTREVASLVDATDLSGLDTSAAAQLAMFQGMALFQLGDVCAGNDKLHDAIQLSDNGPVELNSLRSWLYSVGNRSSRLRTSPLPALSRLRQLATSLGDAISIGSLHLEVARLEGLRGHCINARRHVEIARHLFDRSDRPTLKIMVELVDSTLEMYAGNLGRATRSARSGLELARQADLCMPLAGSFTNLGSLMLFAGNSTRSTRVPESCVGVLRRAGSDPTQRRGWPCANRAVRKRLERLLDSPPAVSGIKCVAPSAEPTLERPRQRRHPLRVLRIPW